MSQNPKAGALIAVVGADGSGKTRLARELAVWAAGERPARCCYLGIGSGRLREIIGRFRPAGRWLEGRISNARKTKERSLGGLAAAGLFLATAIRLARFRRAQRLRRRGWAVVADRYPQDEVAGTFDGPLLQDARPGGWLAARLAAAERHIFRRLVASPPDLVIKLAVDVGTALARKPGHRRAAIEKKIAVMANLSYKGARIAELDARSPFETVFGEARGLAADVFGLEREWPPESS